MRALILIVVLAFASTAGAQDCKRQKMVWPAFGIATALPIMGGGAAMLMGGGLQLDGEPRTAGDKALMAAGSAIMITGAVSLVVSAIKLRKKRQHNQACKVAHPAELRSELIDPWRIVISASRITVPASASYEQFQPYMRR